MRAEFIKLSFRSFFFHLNPKIDILKNSIGFFFFIFIYILAIISKQTAEQLNLPFFSLRFFSLNRRRNSYLSKSPTLYSYLLVVLLIPIQLLWKVLTWLLTSILVWYSFLLTWWKRLLLLRERDSFSYMSDVHSKLKMRI